MKRFGLLVFLVALFGSVALVWAITGKAFSCVSFNVQISGSGDIIKEKRDVRDFRGVDAGGAMIVEITAGKDYSVELEGDDNILPLVTTEIRNGILHIERKSRTSVWTRNRLIARVTLPALDSVNISGASTATISGVNSEVFNLNASGASKIEISGEAREINVDVSGASKLNGENFRTIRAEVEASGASKATLYVSEVINADASGASKIIYFGNPPTVTKDVSGASKVSGS